MKDRLNKVLRAEEKQSRSGAAAARSVPYKYSRALQFLRPILGRRQTHSSTLEPGPSGAVRHESPSGTSQPSHSASSLVPLSGEPAAGPSGVPLPDASGAPSFGYSRQRASDRSLPEFLHLSTVFQNCFKALGNRMDTALSNIDRRLETIETELSRPAKHFFSTIAKGMLEHLTPELQISVMQDCNTSYVRALQQARRMQSATTIPVVPSLASMTPTPAAEPLQPSHRGPRAEGRHHRHYIAPPTPAPARPSASSTRHAEGRKKKSRKTTRSSSESLAAPTQTPRSRLGSSRSRSSQSQSRSSGRLVMPPPSPAEVAVSSPAYIEGFELPSSLLEYGSTSSSSSSPHSQTETYHSPMVAEVDTP
ncbi:uncharacterized protein [Ranitomeya imitator]|uniref:uncharacterized protein n=1 Tax=Ranitomeya imitator TaxID=111125 RepID=UPI0037E8EFD0